MRRTLPQQIAANRRASLFFVFGLVVLLVALCTAIVGYYSPDNWWLGAIGACVLGVISGMVAYYSGSDIILSISHARPANQQEDRILNNVVEEMAIAGGIPKPKIYIIDDSAPNAFATGRDPQHAVVCFTTGLIDKLDRDELQAVAAHELAHIRNYDTRFLTVVSIIAGLIPLIADGFGRSMWYGGGRRRDRDDSGLSSIFMIIAMVLSILAPLFALLLQFAVSRQREFLADATGAEMTRYPEALARALQKIAGDREPLEAANRATQHLYIINPLHHGGGSDLFSTHPSTEARVYALMGLAGNYRRNLNEPTGVDTYADMPPIADQTLDDRPPRLQG
jgi:heat shock protein HtpX